MNQKISATKSFLHWLIVPFIATSMVLWPTYSSGLETLQTDPGDPLLNLYFLEHAFQHFTSSNIFHPSQYWSPSFFWPVKNTLTWSDHLLGQSIIYGIFRPILNPINSYICWISATLVLNYVSIRKSLTKISPNTEDIWISISTLVTTFSPAIAVQLGHPQLLSLFIIGPILYECHRLITEKVENFMLSDWAYLSCLLLINGFFNIYTFTYALYGVIICSAIHIFKRMIYRSVRLKLGNRLILNTICMGIAGSINLYIYLPYLQTLKSFGNRPIELIINNLPKPAGWLLGNDWLLVPPAWNYQTVNPNWISGYEQALFPGWGLLILLIASVFTLFKKKKNKLNQNWLIAITLMILLSMSFDGETGWLVMMKLLPGSGSLRASSRVAMMIVLFSAPCIAIAAENWKFAIKDVFNTVCEISAITASFVSIWAISGGQHQFPYTDWENELSLLSEKLKGTNCDVFWYEWRKNQPPFRAHVIAMHTQLRSNIPTANGYSGQFPSDDWPFTKSSGQNAFRWISEELDGTNHSSKNINLYPKKCIVNINKKEGALIKYYKKLEVPEKAMPLTILDRHKVKVGEYHDSLYILMQNKRDNSGTSWLRLIRDGDSIPSRRGKYHITDAKVKDDKLFITDTNQEEGDRYIWKVNIKTGRFVSQIHISPGNN